MRLHQTLALDCDAKKTRTSMIAPIILILCGCTMSLVTFFIPLKNPGEYILLHSFPVHRLRRHQDVFMNHTGTTPGTGVEYWMHGDRR